MQKNKILLEYSNCTVIKDGKYLLKDISFCVKKGELISIIGRNGVGKSTLCKMITNNLKITSGKITKDSNIKIAYVPQINNFNIIVPISTKDFITINKKSKILTSENYKLLEKLDIIKLLNKNFHSLSGGEKQKVILGRALLLKANILVLDEPSSFIDAANKNNIYNIINQLKQKQGFSVVMVSHDLETILSESDWILYIQEGGIKYQGDFNNFKQHKDMLNMFESK